MNNKIQFKIKSSDLKKISINNIKNDLLIKKPKNNVTTKKETAFFISGGNGFFAQNIIHSILSNRKIKSYKIILLVRNKNNYFLNDSLMNFKEKIFIEDYNSINYSDYLENNIVFIHCAAQLNNLFKLDKLFDSNFELTKKLYLELYKIFGENFSFHYISTLSVFASSDLIKKYYFFDKNKKIKINERTNIDLDSFIFGGYAQSKLCSEFYLNEINKKNKNIYIHRFDLLTPAYYKNNKKLIFNKNENFIENKNFVFREQLIYYIFILLLLLRKEKKLFNKKSYKKITVSMNPVDLASEKFIKNIINNRFLIKNNLYHYSAKNTISLYDMVDFILKIPEKIFNEKYFKLNVNEVFNKHEKLMNELKEMSFNRWQHLKNIFENNKKSHLFNLDLFQTTFFYWKIKDKLKTKIKDKKLYLNKILNSF